MAEPDPSGGEGGGNRSSSGSNTTGGRPQEEALSGTEDGPARVAAAASSSSPLAPAAAESPGSYEEYECRICYNLFDLERHAPKLLECLHTFCLECLSQLHLRAARSPRSRASSGGGDEAGGSDDYGAAIRCPLCRHQTALPGGSAHSLPVNTKRVEAILLQLNGWAPLLRDRLASSPPRLLLQVPRPARQRPLPASGGGGASPSTTAGAGSAGGGISSRDSSSEDLCCLSWRRKAGCVCAVFSVLAMVLLVFAWMEWLTGSIFLGVALALLFFSTMPFVMYRIRFRSQPGTVFLPSLAASNSREASPGRLTPRSRLAAEGRSLS
ncbi:hypothetical protein lerEdw1_008131 [Lerista edwardsae]|nr:hypothetical protein lerEdw1_008131 [Lerista edwardsae]